MYNVNVHQMCECKGTCHDCIRQTFVPMNMICIIMYPMHIGHVAAFGLTVLPNRTRSAFRNSLKLKSFAADG